MASKKRKGKDVVSDPTLVVKILKQDSVDDDAPKAEPTDAVVSNAILLPLEELKTDDDVDKHFVRIADYLINQVTLVAGGQQHQIVELEFYWTSDAHRDPFTHGNEIQRQTGVWYFHRMGSGYKGGSYKGLDVAIGRDDKNVGGVLLRSLRLLPEGTIVNGPSLVVDHLLKLCGADTIASLMDVRLKGDISVEQGGGRPLFLVPIAPGSRAPVPVHRSARFGLNMSKKDVAPEVQQRFIFKLYRFVAYPDKIPKGRPHLNVALHHSGLSAEEIIKISGGTKAGLENVIKAYKEGLTIDPAKWVGAKLSDSDVCKAFASIHGKKK
eukprot:TRINITY_DN5987_c0_g1_i1.p1 TRINITY_DN5987_c0_g1~~TRINITY_DN5987_c0_g1_i1.p1  ORF type:complete len:324 (+),score=100.14 TRINITY_DN5987_c0_g1_i1:46-1017(+)